VLVCLIIKEKGILSRSCLNTIRRLKDYANKAVSNSNSKGILNRCYSKGIGGWKEE
jgi:hypothetical protein